MKKLFSRQLSLVLALMVACSMVCSLQVSAYEDYYSTAYDYDQNFAYDYALLDDDTVKITKATAYYDANLDYTLPQTLDGRTVSEVGEYAFRSCYLNSLTLNHQVKIDRGAFDGCFSNYNTDSYTGYGEYGDSNNYRYTKFWQPVNFPCGTTQIDSGAFAGCRFVNFTIPEGFQTIGSFAFSGCNQLAYIRIPNSVTSIEEGAFDGCYSLLDIYFYGTEEEWNNITVDTMMNSYFTEAEVTFVNDENKDDPAISEDTTYNKFAYLYDVPPYENASRNMVTVNAYLGDTSADTVTIPSKINGFRVGAVGGDSNEVFELSYSINTIVIPDGVSILGNRSFADTRIKNLYLPSGLAYIEESAFQNCSELKTVYFGGSAEDWDNISIAEGNECLTTANIYFDGLTERTLFSYTDNGGCVTITGYNGTQPNVVIPEQIEGKNVDAIGNYAFANCPYVKSVKIPSEVMSIGNSAFADSSITSIELPDRLSTIDSYAFYGCADLTSISIPAGVHNIGSSAFDGSGLRSVTLSEGLQYISWYAFANCTYLESLTIPSTVDTIGSYFIENCPCLHELKVDPANTTYTSRDSNGNECNVIIDKANSEVIVGCGRSVIPSGVKKIGMYAFYNCTSLGMQATDTQFTLPETVEEIGYSAFDGCTSLKNINIPSNTKTIREGAFQGSGLTSIEIPERTEYIGSSALANCRDLESVIIRCSGKIYEQAFANCTNIKYLKFANGITSIAHDAFYPNYFAEHEGIKPIELVEYYGSEADWSRVNVFGTRIRNRLMLNPEEDFDYIVRDLDYVYVVWYKGEDTDITIPQTIGNNIVEGIGEDFMNEIIGSRCQTLYDQFSADGTVTDPTTIRVGENLRFVYTDRIFKAATEIYYSGTKEAWNSIVGEGRLEYFYGNEITYHFAKTQHTDEAGGTGVYVITGDADKDKTLTANTVTDPDTVSQANFILENGTVRAMYDISLYKDGEEVQPSGSVEVKIPVEGNGFYAKVYRVEADGTLTDMHAVLNNSYLIFNTDHFSLYALVDTSKSLNMGDVTGDGRINIRDATKVQKYIAQLAVLNSTQLALADVDGSGIIDVRDAKEIQKYTTKMDSVLS